jgi:hypothetical protein
MVSAHETRSSLLCHDNICAPPIRSVFHSRHHSSCWLGQPVRTDTPASILALHCGETPPERQPACKRHSRPFDGAEHAVRWSVKGHLARVRLAAATASGARGEGPVDAARRPKAQRRRQLHFPGLKSASSSPPDRLDPTPSGPTAPKYTRVLWQTEHSASRSERPTEPRSQFHSAVSRRVFPSENWSGRGRRLGWEGQNHQST